MVTLARDTKIPKASTLLGTSHSLLAAGVFRNKTGTLIVA